MDAGLQIIQNYIKTPAMNIDATQKTIKMEDLAASSSPSTPTSSSLLDIPELTPKSLDANSKNVKKRKSWGQVLPEPKTNLPPRKRAKTADEKEQRRIERVKRNRLAAHNSRERKRQEMDTLLNHNANLEAHIAAMQARLNAYDALYPNANVPAVPKFEFTLDVSSFGLDPPTSHPASTPELESTPAPSQSAFPSPASLMSTMDSPVDTAPNVVRPAVSVGFHPFLDGGNPGKANLSASDHHPTVQFTDVGDVINDDCNTVDSFFDFALFPDSAQTFNAGSDSFFDDSFDGSSTASDAVSQQHAVIGAILGDDVTKPLDSGSFTFDLQPEAGATLEVCDAEGFAIEGADC